LNPERWGSLLIQENYQEECACDKRNNNNNNNNNNNRLAPYASAYEPQCDVTGHDYFT